jgi:hypothetical protein
MSNPFTQTGVESLAKMKQLKFLYINVDAENRPNGEIQLLVDIAGRVPNLKKIDFEFDQTKSWKFVQLYGQLYPNKNILIHQLK